MDTRKTFLVLTMMAGLFCLFDGNLPAAENKVVLDEQFSEINTDNWEGINIPERSSIKDGALSLNFENTEMRITSYDMFKYCELEAPVRYTQPFKQKVYYYFGLMDRKPWTEGRPGNGISFNVFNGTVVLQAGRGEEFPGKFLQLSVFKPVVNQWYVYKISWQPKKLEVFVDGKSCGFTEDPALIPQKYMPVYIDAVSEQNAGPVGYEIDYLKVTTQE